MCEYCDWDLQIVQRKYSFSVRFLYESVIPNLEWFLYNNTTYPKVTGTEDVPLIYLHSTLTLLKLLYNGMFLGAC